MRLFQTFVVSAIRLRPHTKLFAHTKSVSRPCVRECMRRKEKKQNHRSLKATLGLNSARALEFLHSSQCLLLFLFPCPHEHTCLSSRKPAPRAVGVSYATAGERARRSFHSNPEFRCCHTIEARFNLWSECTCPKALLRRRKEDYATRESAVCHFELWILHRPCSWGMQ